MQLYIARCLCATHSSIHPFPPFARHHATRQSLAALQSAIRPLPTGYPEYAVRAEVIGRFFTTLASSTFHDFVNKRKIVLLKGIRGFYKLNDSLRRLGLREVSELPKKVRIWM